MTWSTPGDLKAQVQRLWQRGDILAAIADEQSGLFPKRLSLKAPASADMVEHFDAVRRWIAALQAMKHVRVELRRFRHPVLGENEIPHAVWLDSTTQAVALMSKQGEAARFRQLLAATGERMPQLTPWLVKRPFVALEHADHWGALLDVCDWFLAHPRPDVYIRQVDIPGIDSKFIESQRAVLIELLDRVLPTEAVTPEAGGISQFARRYGLREKPVRIRFRMLDERHHLLPGTAAQDVTLDHRSFARLEELPDRIFVTENEVNFLAFPQLADSMVIFGAGYGFELLAEAAWLHQRQLFYWGDLDTHGFAILDQFRQCFPHAQSLFMDRETLMQHRMFWGREDKPARHDLAHLTRDESELYDDLRYERIRAGLRLEQERVRFPYVLAGLQSIGFGGYSMPSEP